MLGTPLSAAPAGSRARPAVAAKASSAGLFAGLQNLFSGASMGASKREKIAATKEKLLERIAPLQRGLVATPEDKAEVEALAAELERLNPTPKPLAAPELLSAKWELLYTTSESILGTRKPPFLRPSGPIYQFIDGEGLRAKNQESAPLFNSVTATLEPLSDSKVGVQFREFRLLGLLPIKAPPSARGELDVTFLDEDLRVSRGDKGNLFVLSCAERGASF